MHLSGQLSDWSISDLLQIMHVTKKTGSLDIEGDQKGRIHFKDGSVTGADLDGASETYNADDRQSVADVLYVLSSLHAGTFAVGKADGPDRDGWAVDDLLGDVAGLGALEADVSGSGLIDAAGVRLSSDLDDPITLDPADWKVMVGLIQPFNFTHLESRLGRGGAVRVLHALHRLGIAQAVNEEDESQWLDRLAEGLTAESSEPMWLEQAQQDSPAKHLAIEEDDLVPVVAAEESDAEQASEPEEKPVVKSEASSVKGVSAPASTTLTDGVYDEIRRLRSKVSDHK